VPLCITNEDAFICATNGTLARGRLACVIERQEGNFVRAAWSHYHLRHRELFSSTTTKIQTVRRVNRIFKLFFTNRIRFLTYSRGNSFESRPIHRPELLRDLFRYRHSNFRMVSQVRRRNSLHKGLNISNCNGIINMWPTRQLVQLCFIYSTRSVSGTVGYCHM
jgi:hypothetical protein